MRGVSRTAADRFTDVIESGIETLEEFPQAGRSRNDLEPGLRSLVCKRWLLFYVVHEEQVDVVSIVDGTRDLPQLWHD